MRGSKAANFHYTGAFPCLIPSRVTEHGGKSSSSLSTQFWQGKSQLTKGHSAIGPKLVMSGSATLAGCQKREAQCYITSSTSLCRLLSPPHSHPGNGLIWYEEIQVQQDVEIGHFLRRSSYGLCLLCQAFIYSLHKDQWLASTKGQRGQKYALMLQQAAGPLFLLLILRGQAGDSYDVR